jgi:hypothetical protein
MQLYTGCHPDNIDDVRTKFSSCVADVAQWCAVVSISPSSDEFGQNRDHAVRRHWLLKTSTYKQIGSKVIRPVSVVRVLGVLLDTELTTKPHVAKTAATCIYRLRGLRRFDAELAKTLPFVSSWLSSHRGWTTATRL